MRRITALFTATLLFVTAACSNTARGVKEDAEKAGDKVSDASGNAADATSSTASNAGASMGAAMETADVKTALLADTRISATDINVNTNKDMRTVTLNGTVPTAEQKRLAEDVAKAKAPEYSVVNNLTINPAR